MEWPKYSHDTFNTGLHAGPSKVGVDPDDPARLPSMLVLAAYPSPAASDVKVRLGVPSSGSGDYKVDVFDVRGRHVINLVDAALVSGFYEMCWHLTDRRGGHVSSGVYFVKVSGKGARLVEKVMVLR